MSESHTPYDGLAWFYDRYWGSQFLDRIYPVLEAWFLPQLPSEARILDLCCGTGQMAGRLTEAGYKVTGLDNSKEMLAFAKRNAPLAGFVESNAENFALPEQMHGVISLYDSLNHLMTEERLLSAFASVFAALKPGGLFLFDLNIEEGYLKGWKGSWSIVEPDHVLAVRNSYNPELKRGRLDAAMFRLIGGVWYRTDEVFEQTAFDRDAVSQLLTSVGFILQKTGLSTEFGMAGGGRQFWLAEKPA